MTDDPKKNKDPEDDPLEILDDLTLSKNPFAEENEVTQLEQKFEFEENDFMDDFNEEVTEKSHIENIFELQKNNLKPIVKENAPTDQKVEKKRPAATKPKKPISARRQKIKKTILPTLALLFIISFIYGIYYVMNHFSFTDPEVQVQNRNLLTEQRIDYRIQLTSIKTLAPKQKENLRVTEVHWNEELKLQFFIEDWQTKPEEALEFKIEVRIFDSQNNLIHFEPEFRSYSHVVDAKTHQILIQPTVLIRSNTKAGTYRLQFKVIDLKSQRSRTLQTRFRVLAKPKR